MSLAARSCATASSASSACWCRCVQAAQRVGSSPVGLQNGLLDGSSGGRAGTLPRLSTPHTLHLPPHPPTHPPTHTHTHTTPPHPTPPHPPTHTPAPAEPAALHHGVAARRLPQARPRIHRDGDAHTVGGKGQQRQKPATAPPAAPAPAWGHRRWQWLHRRFGSTSADNKAPSLPPSSRLLQLRATRREQPDQPLPLLDRRVCRVCHHHPPRWCVHGAWGGQAGWRPQRWQRQHATHQCCAPLSIDFALTVPACRVLHPCRHPAQVHPGGDGPRAVRQACAGGQGGEFDSNSAAPLASAAAATAAHRRPHHRRCCSFKP